MAVIVEARKKSEDPVQEALRQNKDTWNHDASLLIAQLIAFKKGLNGRGEPKIGIPPGSIKDPMPHEVGSYLDQLADRYNKLISDAHKIIEEQNVYSETRKKSVKEQTASFDPEILKLASWWGSRALTYTKNQYLNPKYWFSSDKAIDAKMMMLKVSVDLVKQLKVIDNFVVSKEINAVPNAIYDFDKFVSSFNKLLLPNIKKLVKLENESKTITNTVPRENSEVLPTGQRENVTENLPDFVGTEELPREKEELTPQIDQNQDLELSGKKTENLAVKIMLSDIIYSGRIAQVMNLLNVNKRDIDKFELDIKKLRKVLDNLAISGKGSLEEANYEYNNILSLSGRLLQQDPNSLSSQLEKAEKVLLSKAGSVSVEFEKLAKNFLNRWLKRQKLKILPDSDDRIRLEASKKLLNIINSFDKFQNSLEKNEPNLDVIKDKLIFIGVELGELSDDLFYLGKTHNDEYLQSKLNGKATTHLIPIQILNRLQKMKEYFASLSSEIE